MAGMPEWIVGEQDLPEGGPDMGRAWWVPTDADPIVRVACVDGFAGREVIADFPPAQARALVARIEAAIAEAEASRG